MNDDGRFGRADIVLVSLRAGTVVVPILVASALLASFGVPLGEVFRYLGYLFFLVLWPGGLTWRAVACGFRQRLDRSWTLEHLVCGAALGYVIELVSYVIARAIDHPRWYVVAPVGLAVALTMREARKLPAQRQRVWRSGPVPDGRRAETYTSTLNLKAEGSRVVTAVIVVYTMIWYARQMFRTHPLQATAITDPDEMFHLALVGELRHHFPATYPYVEYPHDLTYQWFVHAHMAAASWATGIEPETLYRRFDPLVLLVLAVLGAGLLAVRISDRTVAGPLAAATLVLVGSFDVTGAVQGEAAAEERFLQGMLFMHSPTQALAFALTPALVLVALRLLDDEPVGRATWVLLSVLGAAVSGAKVTFLPLYVCGFITSAVVMLISKRAAWCRSAMAALLLAAVIVASSLILYRGDSQSLGLHPLQTTEYYMARLGLGGGGVPGKLVVTASLLAMWLVPTAGVLALLRSRRTRWDPTLWWLLGASTSGYGATFLLGHGGNSQLYFGRAASVLIGVAAAWGMAVLFDTATRRQVWFAVTAAVGAGLLHLSVRLRTENLTAPGPLRGEVVETPLLRIWVNLPVVILLGVLMLAAGMVIRDVSHGRYVLSLRVALSFVMGLGLARGMAFVGGHGEPEGRTYRAAVYGWEGREIAAWLRERSSPQERIWTNAHCGPVRPAPEDVPCDARHFWMSALTERRFVVEGWAYTAKSGPWTDPFWGDPTLLAANDGLLVQPDEEAVRDFRDDHRIGWIFADLRDPIDVAALDDLPNVELRRSLGPYVVLRVMADKNRMGSGA